MEIAITTALSLSGRVWTFSLLKKNKKQNKQTKKLQTPQHKCRDNRHVYTITVKKHPDSIPLQCPAFAERSQQESLA